MISSNNTVLNLHKTIESMSVKDNTIQKIALGRLFLSYQYPGLEKRDVKDLILVLWKIDTLGDSSTWSLFHTNGNHFLRKIKWQKREPYQLLDPDTFGSERLISNENSHQLITSFSNFSKETEEFKGIILDGVRCGLISPNINVTWWYKTSQLNQALESWFADTVLKLDSIFNDAVKSDLC